MARYNYFNTLRAPGYTYFMDPSTAFINWLEAVEGDEKFGFIATTFAEEMAGERTEATCLLDYLFVWLVEGGAKRYCPTYENWLLTIIAIIDQFHRGRFGERWTEHHRDSLTEEDIPDGKSEPRDCEELKVNEITVRLGDHRTVGIGHLQVLPAALEPHPALDRTLFERA